MAKRIYSESLKKWAKGVGVVGVAGAFSLLFIFLSSSDLIDVIGFSGDQYCAGTTEDSCYATITFKANEDIFVYPIGYDPYGRNETFEFKPGVKEWKLQRSWGTSWKTYDLENGCSGTWCGAPNSNGATYSLVWRKGKEYTIRIVALKNNPSDTIKWSAFSGEVDPYWFPVKTFENIYLLDKQTNHTEYWETSRPVYNYVEKCIFHPGNNSWESCRNFSYDEITEHSREVIDLEWQEIWMDDKLWNITDKENLWCYETVNEIICKSTLDCDGKFKKPGVRKGCSYVTINLETSKLTGEDYLGSVYVDKIKKVINEAEAIK